MPSVSVLIPTLNEAEFIESCLNSVLAFVLPENVSIEVFVLDGGSVDSTRTIVNTVAVRDDRVRLINNPGRIQSTALNIGVEHSHADYIMRLDAHSAYPTNYLKLCYETSIRTGAANVGGIFVTQARGSSYEAALVQALTTHPF